MCPLAFATVEKVVCLGQVGWVLTPPCANCSQCLYPYSVCIMNERNTRIPPSYSCRTLGFHLSLIALAGVAPLSY